MYKLTFVLLLISILCVGLNRMLVFQNHSRLQMQERLESPERVDLAHCLRLINIGNVKIVDVRSKAKFDMGHITLAISLPITSYRETLDPLIPELNAAHAVIIYDDGGLSESLKTYAKMLKARGVKGIVIYEGGFTEWYRAGLPIEK